ncbi:hypothetical protein H4R26_002550 [Coemansia thaxteri]|uniref:C2 domain-containing protein n=1 Tax=Coemansia thaxteri TaxID=2663907 RepID=A0A9W8BJM6_9FUNG|nr:hypothetical protein H4R26_002550 [Coemansia thaxteri]
MVAFLYYIPVLKTVLTWDYSVAIRPIFNSLDNFLYRNYRIAGCYGPKWSKEAEYLGGLLCVEVIKGRDIPRKTFLNTSSQYIHVRVGGHSDYCVPAVNNDGGPHFRMTSYFEQDLYSNTLIEITLLNDGIYKDTVVGRVTVPIKELHDVRSFHGWLALDDEAGDPAGYVYVACMYRKSTDAEFNVLNENTFVALKESEGVQWLRQAQGRSKNRIKVRAMAPIDSEPKLSQP